MKVAEKGSASLLPTRYGYADRRGSIDNPLTGGVRAPQTIAGISERSASANNRAAE